MSDLSVTPANSPQRLLAEFLSNHPVRHASIRGVDWTWTGGGDGTEAVMILPGALGFGQTLFHVAAPLGATHHVVTVDYPPVPTFKELVDGLAAILEREAVTNAHVVGASYGGMVAQVFARAYPDRVSSLTLSSTGVPDARRIRTTKRTLRVLPWVPLGVVRGLLRLILRVLTRELGPDAAFWRRLFNSLAARLDRSDLTASYSRVLEFDGLSFSPGDLSRLAGRMLILETADDPLVKRGVADALRALYPEAQVHTFPHGGHAASIVNGPEYVSVVKRFLSECGSIA